MSSRNRKRWVAPGGIRTRVALFVFLTSFFCLLALSVFCFRSFSSYQRRDFDSELFNLALDLSQELQRASEPRELQVFRNRLLPFDPSGMIIQIVESEDLIRMVAPREAEPARHAALSQTELESLSREGRLFKDLKRASERDPSPVANQDYRLLILPLDPRASQFRSPRRIELFAPLQSLQDDEEALLEVFCISIPLILLILALGSYGIAGRALLPLRQLIARADAIDSSDLSLRLPEIPGEDEMSQLSRTLNRLLERLENAFESQERFIADASHQMKTPLALLRSEIELYAKDQAGSPSAQSLAQSVHQEIDYLTQLVERLLLLARISATGKEGLELSLIRVDELLVNLLEKFSSQAKAGSKRFQFVVETSEDDSIEPSFFTSGDAPLLQSLFENLIENALKYSPAGSAIRVHLASEDASIVEVSIEDEGPGVAKDLRPKVFERFFRTDTRSKGHGLGLTIAREIARAHGATLSLEPGPSSTGTVVRVRLNRCDQSSY